jgi:hypothetical protein
VARLDYLHLALYLLMLTLTLSYRLEMVNWFLLVFDRGEFSLIPSLLIEFQTNIDFQELEYHLFLVHRQQNSTFDLVQFLLLKKLDFMGVFYCHSLELD